MVDAETLTMPLQAGRDDADPAAQTLFIHWRVAAERPGGIATATIAAGGASRKSQRENLRPRRRRFIFYAGGSSRSVGVRARWNRRAPRARARSQRER